MELRGKAALITGAAVRLGRAMARALAAEGVGVAVHYRRSSAEARALVRDLAQEYGVQAVALGAALGGPEAASKLVQRARERLGRLDILINNAAIFPAGGLCESSVRQLKETFSVNFLAPLFLMRAFAARCSCGVIVNVLDQRIAGWDVAHGPYVLSKKALADATRLAALEFAPAIRVNAVAPGAILPPSSAKGAPVRAGPVPLQRQCTVEEVADAVLFLLRNDALTGQIIFVDGGQHLL